MKKFIAAVNNNKGTIIKRTAIIAAGVVAATLVAGLIKTEVAEAVAEAAE